MRESRPISWVKGALRDFKMFPAGAQERTREALADIAEGEHPYNAKPLTGLGAGVLELVLKEKGDAYRVVYALQLAEESGCCTPFKRNQKAALRRRSKKSI